MGPMQSGLKFTDRILQYVAKWAEWKTDCAFTPDATCANKSRYSRVVGRLNILSLLASFAREIRFIRA